MSIYGSFKKKFRKKRRFRKGSTNIFGKYWSGQQWVRERVASTCIHYIFIWWVVFSMLYCFRVVHILPWRGLLDVQTNLRETFRVPDLKTGKMMDLITPLKESEEKMFINMMRRLHTIFKVCCVHTTYHLCKIWMPINCHTNWRDGDCLGMCKS